MHFIYYFFVGLIALRSFLNFLLPFVSRDNQVAVDSVHHALFHLPDFLVYYYLDTVKVFSGGQQMISASRLPRDDWYTFLPFLYLTTNDFSNSLDERKVIYSPIPLIFLKRNRCKFPFSEQRYYSSKALWSRPSIEIFIS